MSEAMLLKAQRREKAGTRASRRERLQGRIPVIIYGHKKEPVSVTLNYHALSMELQHHHRLLELELDKKREKVLIKAIQYDHLGDKIIHLDLTRVDLDEKVKVTVQVELKGTAAGAVEGGVLEQMHLEIELECLVTSIPESLRVMVTEMKVGDFLLAKDIELPEGTVLITDPETQIASLRVIAEVEEEDEAEGAGDQAEPEVITAREKPEDQEESKK